jgi:protein-S-isoprenylcysteine O-methyltransferase Ste14
VRTAGIVLGVFGAGLSMRSALLLLGRGRPQRGPRPALVLAGPYLRVRNPLLAGLVLMLAGAALATASWAVGAVTVAVSAAAHAWVTRIEEPRLRARCGAAYAEYVRAVPRWLPGGRQGSGST